MKKKESLYVLPVPAVVLASVLSLVACAPDSAANGAQLYQQNCVTCHGATGSGDGPSASDLPVPPANLRQLSAANGGTFPTERVMSEIYGYRGKEYQGLMPQFGPVLESPPVDWVAPDGRVIQTPTSLLALSRYLETLQDE